MRPTIKLETHENGDEVAGLAYVGHHSRNAATRIYSGSLQTIGITLAPCSQRSVEAIATRNSADLLDVAAEVCRKEPQSFHLSTREAPISLVHSLNTESVTLADGTILPHFPTCYHKSRAIDDLLAHRLGKMVHQFVIEHELVQVWA